MIRKLNKKFPTKVESSASTSKQSGEESEGETVTEKKTSKGPPFFHN